MSDVCKHTPELAQAVVDAGAVAYLSPLIMHPDSKLKRQVRQGEKRGPGQAGGRAGNYRVGVENHFLGSTRACVLW